MNDEELQEMMDNGDRPKGSVPEEYKKLFSFLDKTENDILSPGFAHRVTARIEEKQFRDPIRSWIIGLLVFMVLITVPILALVFSRVPNLRLPESGQVNLYVMFALTLFILALYSLIERRGRKDTFTGNRS